VQNHPVDKGLYGVQFPYYDLLLAIYGKDIATGEGTKDMSDVVNMEQELVVGVGNGNDEEEEEDRTSKETPRHSFNLTSSSSKKRKK
jgi:hypothetical protein